MKNYFFASQVDFVELNGNNQEILLGMTSYGAPVLTIQVVIILSVPYVAYNVRNEVLPRTGYYQYNLAPKVIDPHDYACQSCHYWSCAPHIDRLRVSVRAGLNARLWRATHE
ncbi:hypothetical protein [Microbulbifer agarilyticus]|uniref:hypothetical protein n=1 Tax=Microbulbifer agarilyticus TaxID=260552 RepID=UPI001CD37593|nr:hypothetical protein [Microbulbifer agarilyticus]MCA0893648.1 hypothetical protein [Microbulbifer agarilyticus]